MEKNKESTHKDATIESTTAKNLALPLRVLISPLKAFKQLAVNPTAKGLLSLVVLIIGVSAAEWYAYATKIVLTIDGQPVDFIATGDFSDWFLGVMSTIPLSIAIYWLIVAAGLALISRFSFKGSKVISLRVSLVTFGYLLSVFIVLYAVRAAIYLALPRIPFPSSTFPGETEVWLAHTQNWAPFPVLQLLVACAGFAWLVLLGTVAIKAMQEVSWFKAGLMSVTGFLLTLPFLGLP